MLFSPDSREQLLERADADDTQLSFKEWLFVTHVRFAEAGTFLWAFISWMFGQNLWNDDKTVFMMLLQWVFLWTHIPMGIFASVMFPVTIIFLYSTLVVHFVD